ncbi:hypothetical protein [Rhodococcus sp. Q]|uniref:hypothetical protein n=1 Tax=Rhodococcus sp. Q TaxID=2502252 RepID=UPI0010F97928|nr:hypothetical protein [Rhodococcus sp. Q]
MTDTNTTEPAEVLWAQDIGEDVYARLLTDSNRQHWEIKDGKLEVRSPVGLLHISAVGRWDGDMLRFSRADTGDVLADWPTDFGDTDAAVRDLNLILEMFDFGERP